MAVIVLEHYKRILVTGGLGFIGRHLVRALLDLGKEVVILDNLATVTDPSPPAGSTLIKADIRDSRKVAEAVRGTAPELVFHVAANASGTVSVEEPRLDFDTNARGTFNVLEASLAARVTRFVYVSSASVYGRPQYFPMDEGHPRSPFVPYGTSKLTGEVYTSTFFTTYDLPTVIARPFCVYGPGENPRTALVEVGRYLRWHLNHKPIQIVGDKHRKTRDFVHVSDVVRGLLLVADKAAPGEIFNFGSGEEVSMLQLAEIIGEVTGRPAEIRELSHIKDDTYRLVSDISRLRALGYEPRFSLREGLRQLAAELGDYPELPGTATIFKKGQQAEQMDPQDSALRPAKDLLAQ
ncbi:MAG: NAD-dependent epimerase/dehydratase family protein [Deltaproteobacteria bacterium]|nr:NAD-dependent epimerase/dehydratase family protein [Deltaproteobacteria bacterium]